MYAYPSYPLEYGDLSQNYKNILFIDNAVDDLSTIINSINSDTFYIIYSGCSSKVDVSDLLRTLSMDTVDRIGFFFALSAHSKIFLDRRPFYDPSMNYVESDEPQSDVNFDFMIDIINTYNIKNIDYLACNTLSFQSWNNYYNALIDSTNVIVGASDNETGNIKYGGDWILETTGEDVELIYFNKSIQYYKYLLDALTWVSGSELIDQINGIVVYNGNIYASVVRSTGYIFKVNVATGQVTLNWSPTLDNAEGVTISYPYLYTALTSNGAITQINMDTGAIVKSSWVIGTYGSKGALYTFGGNYLYAVATTNPNPIQIIELSTGNVVNLLWFKNTLYTTIFAITYYNGFLYVAIYTSTILKMNPITAAFTVFNTSVNSARALTAFGDYLYVANDGNNTVSQILLSTGQIVNANWATGLNSPRSMTTDGTYLYIGNGNGTISKFSLAGPPINITTNPTGIKYKFGANFIDICNNFVGKYIGEPPTFLGQNFSTGIFAYYNSIKYDLAELYTINAQLNTSLTINSNIFTRYNDSLYDINSFFIPSKTQVVNITGATGIRGITNASITGTLYNPAGAPSGTLYAFQALIVSQTLTTLGTFRLSSGSLNCYLLCIGPGSGAAATDTAGGGGSGYFIAFSLALGVTYTITYVSSGTAANTIPGYTKIQSNDSPQTINITTPGGYASNNAASATQTGTITGGTAFAGGARATTPGANGGNGFVIEKSNINTGSVNNNGYVDLSNLITLQNGKNGFSGAGKMGATFGGRGGLYNEGGFDFIGSGNTNPGSGYGTSAGSRGSSGTATANGSRGAVLLYLSQLI